MKTVLSIDFDFFVRENPAWDFGHSEDNETFKDLVWYPRYQAIDLHKECDLKFADFRPDTLVGNVQRLGLKFKKDIKLAVADSHVHAYDFICQEIGRCNVVNFDAHHDMFDECDGLNCGNWAAKLRKQGKVDYYFWVKPTWLSEFGDFHPLKKWKCVTMDYREACDIKINLEVDAVFMCRSSVWVPPHLDGEFDNMLNIFGKLVPVKGDRFRTFGTFPKREAPTQEQAEVMRKAYQSAMKRFLREAKRKGVVTV